MIKVIVKEWKDLTREQKRIAHNEIWKDGLYDYEYNKLSDQKFILANCLKPYCFDECIQKIYVFNSKIKD